MLLENLDWFTTQHRHVCLEIDRQYWRVEHSSTAPGESCAQCHRRATLTFVNSAHVPVCPSCAREAVGSRFARWPRPAPRRAIAHGAI